MEGVDLAHIDHAIIIGVNHYEDSEVRNLPFAASDVLSLSKTLITHCGVKPSRLSILSDIENKPEKTWIGAPSRSIILDRLTTVTANITKNDLVLFYFAGHGFELNRKPYLLTSDTRLSVPEETAISVEILNRILEDTKARFLLRVYDCCRDPFTAGRSLSGRMTQVLQDSLLHGPRGNASWCSCSSSEVAHEEPEYGHGVFTYFFFKGLQGAARGDNGNVSLYGLADYVLTGVEAWCQQKGFKQNPHVDASTEGSVILAETKLPSKIDTSTVEPLLDLAEFLSDHVDGTASYVRNLKLSTDEEFRSIFKDLSEVLQERVEFLSSSMHIDIKEIGRNDVIRSRGWMGALQDMNRHEVKSDFHDKPWGLRIKADGLLPVIPSTKLDIFLLRFSSFYWLWFHHSCGGTDYHRVDFKPTPPTSTGYRVIKAGDATLSETILKHSLSILSVISEDIKTWSAQLKEFIENHTEHLAKE